MQYNFTMTKYEFFSYLGQKSPNPGKGPEKGAWGDDGGGDGGGGGGVV